MKKLYESPSIEKCNLAAEEMLMTTPSVSDTGYGWDDNGPVGVITPVE